MAATAEVTTPLLDPAGYAGIDLAVSPIAHEALSAWCMLQLARLALQHGNWPDAKLSLAVLAAQAQRAGPRVARTIQRDLHSLRCALAVAEAVDVAIPS